VPATETLKAIATKSGYTNSTIASAAYNILPLAVQPTFSPVAGTYASAQSVTITSGTSGATICYTTNGTVPTELTGTPGSCGVGTALTNGGSITVSTSMTVNAIATKNGYSPSAPTGATYTIGGASFSQDTQFVSALASTNGDASITGVTTAAANELLVVFIARASDGTELPQDSSAVAATGGGLSATLNFTKRGSINMQYLSGNLGQVEVWYATATVALTGATITQTHGANQQAGYAWVVSFPAGSTMGNTASSGYFSPDVDGAVPIVAWDTGGAGITVSQVGSRIYGVGVDFVASGARTFLSGQSALATIGEKTYGGAHLWVQSSGQTAATGRTAFGTSAPGGDGALLAVEIKHP
jgi:hypothetical protein